MTQAIFLSYASQDADAARRICEALRAAELEVWFDQSELRGGDAWDASIRKQIKECSLFVPIISTHTEERLEGYFRLEWRLADQRTHLMAKGKPFLLPIVIDDTHDAGAHVPDSFLDVQWTRLPHGGGGADGEASETFARRVASLLQSPAISPASLAATPTTVAPSAPSTQPTARATATAPNATALKAKLLLAGGLGLVFVAALAFMQPWKSAATPEPTSAASNASPEIKRLVAQVEDLIRDPMTATRENYVLADELMQRVLKAENNNADYWILAARVSQMLVRQAYDFTPQRTQLLNEQIEKAAKLRPDAIALRELIARQQLINRKDSEATRLASEILAKDPVNREALSVRAEAARREGRDRDVAEALAALQKLPGGDPLSVAFETLSLAQAARLYEAEKTLDQLLAVSPTRLAYFLKMEYVEDYLADPLSAAAYGAQIPKKLLQEESIGAITAQTLILTGKGDDALALLNQIPRDFFSEFAINAPKGLLTGRAHEAAGRPAAAAAEWRSALAVVEKRLASDANSLPLLNSKALLQAMLGQKNEALETLRLRTELGAKDRPLPLVVRALVLVRCGKEAVAIEQVRADWGEAKFRERSRFMRDLAHMPIYAKLRQDKYIAGLIAEHYAFIKAARASPSAKP